MQVFHKLEDVPSGFGPTVVTVGNFDGVHRAHGHVLSDIVQRAREQGVKAVAVTFEPHPEMQLRGEPVSSSRIRKLLDHGRVSLARHLLGRPFTILSTPGRGRGYGSKYTVPTINLSRYE